MLHLGLILKEHISPWGFEHRVEAEIKEKLLTVCQTQDSCY